ncbi:MAG: hypothetical protein PHT32_04390, partial [Candidatus Omnitrophica bacterium]|nr:hypothetical protein [Candidatus Omnitrophota bacterium]
MKHNKGFVIVIVVAFLVMLVLIAGVVVSMGSGEILQTKIANDLMSARYAARSGAEIMYALMKSKEGQTVIWPLAVPSADSVVKTRNAGGQTVGTFTASADVVTTDIFGIVSEGTVNGRKSRVIVRYGFDSPFNSGYPLGCIGPMSLSGAKLLGFRSWVRAEGPLASGSTVTTNNFVQVSGETLENQSFSAPSFWLGDTYDTNNDGSLITDINSDGSVTVADIPEGQETIFSADDVNSDGVINDKDAFTYYYTTYLDDAANNSLGVDLGITPGEENYYTGSQTFDPWSVPVGTPVIFVDGSVDILFSDTAWWGG